MLYAEKFHKDPRLQKAKSYLEEALLEHTSKINKIKPPVEKLKIGYQEWIEQAEKLRGAKLYFPYLGSGIGNGSLVELLDGSVKYDMITGIGVHFFGHSHPLFFESSFQAALEDTVMQGNLQQNKEGIELAGLLAKHSGLPHAFLTTSGVMANENALKIAFQKNTPATRILAFEHCFAGRTLTFSQITDKPLFREGLPQNIAVDYIPFYNPNDPEKSIEEAKNRLLQAIQRYPKGHALMIFELIQGEGGFYSGSTEFFEPLMKICKEHKIGVFADEIQTFARTSELFAFQHFNLSKYIDIAAVGKLTQAAATLFTEEYRPKPGLLSQTFIGSTSALKAGNTLIKHLLNHNFFGKKGRNLEIQKQFSNHLKKLEKKGLVKGPFGVGCMVAFTPFDGLPEKTTALVYSLFEKGVIAFIAGANPSRIRMLVPGGVIKDKEIDEVMAIIETSLKDVHASH